MTDRSNRKVAEPVAEPAERNITFLRQGDQRMIATIVAVLATLIATTTAWYAWQSGGLVHIDRMPANTHTFQVDINTADWTEISALPNIGETMAQRIVEFRDQHGPFATLESLAQVDGIGHRTLQLIGPYLSGLPGSDELIADSQ